MLYHTRRRLLIWMPLAVLGAWLFVAQVAVTALAVLGLLFLFVGLMGSIADRPYTP